MSGSRASGRSSNSPESSGDSGSGRGTRGDEDQRSQASRSLEDTPFVPPLESGFANLRRELPQLVNRHFFRLTVTLTRTINICRSA